MSGALGGRRIKTREYSTRRGDVHGDGGHDARRSTLTLLMARVGANHPHHTVATDDFAVATHFLDRCSDFHDGVLDGGGVTQ